MGGGKRPKNSFSRYSPLDFNKSLNEAGSAETSASLERESDTQENFDEKKMLKEIIKSCLVWTCKCKFCKSEITGKSEKECQDNYLNHMKNDCKVLKHVKSLRAIGLAQKDFKKLKEIFDEK